MSTKTAFLGSLCSQMLPLLIILMTTGTIDAALTAAQKTEYMIIHNRLREAVYPRAAKMVFLTWNTRLESLAQAASERCKFEHNYGGDYSGLGENIYMGFRTNATQIVLAWHIEKVAFNYATATCNTAGMKLPSCGHYKQVVSDSALEIGCGHHLCGKDHLVFCEYSAGVGASPYASGDTACSKCPSSRGLCLNSGFCVNSSMVSQADVQSYYPGVTAASAECNLNCSNCGSSGSIPGTIDCFCRCVSGVAGGSYCENRVANSNLSCSACSNLNTPCLNGGVELNGATCACRCPDSFVGPRCQVYRPQYLNGIRISIGAEHFCAFDQCLRVPVTRTQFKVSVWSRLRTAIAQAVNTFCTASAANFAQCCPASAGQTPSADKTLIADTDVGYLDNEHMFTEDSGLLGLVVYANSSSPSNTLCPGSRRKRAALQAMVAQSALRSAIQQSNSNISASLVSCCGLSLQSIVTYQSYITYTVNDIVGGIGGGGGGVGGGASGSGAVKIDSNCGVVVLAVLLLLLPTGFIDD